MSYKKTEMLYNDGKYYKWKAEADHDNPFVKRGTDYLQLNRTEGYEVLYFINQFGKNHKMTNLEDYQKIEEMIRYEVPSKIHHHDEISEWIIENWSSVN